MIDRLFLGTDDDARDERLLQQAHITSIVNCAQELPNHYPDQFVYLRLELKDPDPSFRDVIHPANDWIAEQRAKGGVLVHCQGALSRSPSIVLACLCALGHDLKTAANMLAAAAPTHPNKLFLRQLLEVAQHAHTTDTSLDESLLLDILCRRETASPDLTQNPET